MVTRVRSRGGFTLSTPIPRRTRNPDCSSTSWTTQPDLAQYGMVGVLENMTDNVTPDFYSRRRRGLFTFSPMSYSKRVSEIVDPGVGPYREAVTQNMPCGTRFENEFQDNWFASILTLGVPGPFPVRTVLSDSEIADLTTEVTTRCWSDRGKADSNLFESVAEINSTLALLFRPQRSLFTFLNRNGKSASRLSPENAWLAYRYGIKPFIKDVEGIIEGLDKKVGKRRKTTRASGKIQRYQGDSIVCNRSNMDVTVNVQMVDSVTARAMSVDEYVATAASNIGFTTKGLSTLPWELVPYSFVIDWFVNVGDFLGALVPVPGYTQLGSCITVERVSETTYTAAHTKALPAGGYIDPPIRGASGTCYSSLTTKTRSTLGAPGLVIKSDFKLDNAVRAADAMALLTQKVDRLFGARRR